MTEIVVKLYKGPAITLDINLDPPLYVDEQLDCVIKSITHEREVTEWNG